MRRWSLALPLVFLFLLLCAGTADARIKLFIEERPAQPRGTSEELPFSQFPDRSTATDHRYDLYCPHTVEANPLVVVALDVNQSLERAESIAQLLVKAGLIVVVVEPAPDLAAYLPKISAVLDEVLAAQPLEAREPGCERSGAIAAWGAGRGGVAVAELAKTRAAGGRPFAAVVTVYAGTAREVAEGLQTPLLEIENSTIITQHNPGARTLGVWGGEPCFLSWYEDPCRQRDDPARATQTSAIYERSRQFFRAFVDRDAAARAAVDRWDGETIGGGPAPVEEPVRPRTYVLLGLPLLFGGTNHSEGGFSYGIRPELVLARIPTRDHSVAGPGFGCGIYGELLRWSGITSAGAGVTCVAYFGGLGIAPSAGLATRAPEDARARENAMVAGLFVGARGWGGRLGSLDRPVGIRVDGRFGYGGSSERSVLVAVELDLTLLGQIFVGLFTAPIL
jgi:hypothetical protein